MIRRGFQARRLMRDFENRCPVLAQGAQEVLQQHGEKLEIYLNDLVEFAGEIVRQRRAHIERITDAGEREVVQNAVRKKVTALRRGIIEAAEAVATEGVRDFASGLLRSQGRLGVHATTYTARLASELRHWLNSSEVMKTEPLPPWQDDSIAQKGVQTCEDALAERQESRAAGRPRRPKQPQRGIVVTRGPGHL